MFEFYDKKVKAGKGKKTETVLYFRGEWSNSGVDRKATDKDKAQHPGAWADYQANQLANEPSD